MAVSFSAKDPDETLDYAVDWTGRGLEGDSILSFEATVLTGAIIVVTEEYNGLLTTVWLRGGTAGEVATLLLRIETTAGRIMEETASIKIVSR